MSILRYSIFENDLYVPHNDGRFDEKVFTRRDGVGKLGTFKRPADKADIPAALAKAAAAFSQHLSWASDAYSKLPANKPLCIMAHGFLFDPSDATLRNREESDNPHVRTFHFELGNAADEIRAHTTGWPARLEFADADAGAQGLAIGFGWYSKPGLAKAILSGTPNIYARAYDYARESSWLLLALLEAIREVAPGRAVDIFCHSLGSALVIRALAVGCAFNSPALKQLERVIILGGSEYCGEAQLFYNRLKETVATQGIAPGTGPHVYNIVSTENFVLDFFGENFGPKGFFSNTQVVGHDGLKATTGAERWIDLQIDGSNLRKWAQARGLTISGDQPGNIWDHWYYYTFPGNMQMYTKILRERAEWNLSVLRSGAAPVPEGVMH